MAADVCNSVASLKEVYFSRRSNSDKLALKQLGPPSPKLIKKRSHVDILYQKLQKKDIDAVFIKGALESFTSSVQTIRDSDLLQEPSGTDRPRTALTEEAKQRLYEEVCDTILAHTKARFSFTGHLVSATLVQGNMFERYCH
ncbi:unnamed protein product [Gadus morhua 'NCC']